MPSRGGSEYAAHARRRAEHDGDHERARRRGRSSSARPPRSRARRTPRGTPLRRPRARGTAGESGGARSGSRTTATRAKQQDPRRPAGRSRVLHAGRPAPVDATLVMLRSSSLRAGWRLRRDCAALGVEDGDRRGVDARVHRLADPQARAPSSRPAPSASGYAGGRARSRRPDRGGGRRTRCRRGPRAARTTRGEARHRPGSARRPPRACAA